MPSPSRAPLILRLFERLRRFRGLIWGVGLVMLILAAKLWLIDEAGSSLPILDQIDAEGEVVLRPWLEGNLGWRNFWHPHNEHRVVLTKLVAWGLVAVNGQWDAYVEMLAGALMHALLVPVMLAWIRPQIRRDAFAVLAIAFTAMWVLPINWENTLQGFQTHFYFVIWLGYLQLRNVLGSERIGWRWSLGNLCGFLALFASASGGISSLAVVFVVAAEALRSRQISPLQIASIALALLWVALGWAWRNPVPGHDFLKAHSVSEFASQLGRMLVWPYGTLGLSLGAFALIVPYRVISRFRSSTRSSDDRIFAGLAVWVFTIMAATAFYRGNGLVLSSRYVDQFYLGLVLQGLAFALVKSPRWRTAFIALWLVSLGLALNHETRTTWRKTLADRGALMAKQEDHVRAFFATGDPTALTNAPPDEVPHPLPAVLVERWSHESIQRIMPASVRRAVAFPPLTDIVADGVPVPLHQIIAQTPGGKQGQPWRWKSATLPETTLPVLRFQFSGALGDPDAALQLSITGTSSSIRILPDSPSPGRWKTINAIRPQGPWSIELHDSDKLAHFSLTAPVELGWLSWVTEKLIKHHAWMIGIGIGLSMIGGLLSCPRPNTPRR